MRGGQRLRPLGDAEAFQEHALRGQAGIGTARFGRRQRQTDKHSRLFGGYVMTPSSCYAI